jgi:lysophospholipid acyltransferase (LPLAT)-like uncharacterized protein
MKIRQPWLLKILGGMIALLVRYWIGSLRYRYRPRGPNVDPHRPGLRGHYIYAFWHENLLLPAYQYGRRNIHVLISQHADGELIAEACKHLGFRLVRGSTTRGGVEALRLMKKLANVGHLGITPDGPRGPRRKVQVGAIYLAARTGLPIVPIGFAFARAWRMSSWDRFALPLPYSHAVCVTGTPIAVPKTADRVQLNHYRELVQQAMDQASLAAERLAGQPLVVPKSRQPRQAA